MKTIRSLIGVAMSVSFMASGRAALSLVMSGGLRAKRRTGPRPGAIAVSRMTKFSAAWIGAESFDADRTFQEAART